MNEADLEVQLEAIYAELPEIDCQKRCHSACGPIVMSEAEWLRVSRPAGERGCEGDLVCPYLERDSGLCGVYAVRPLICRLWGAIEALTCDWGCVPERLLGDSEVAALVERVQALSGGRVHSLWHGWQPFLERSEGGRATS